MLVYMYLLCAACDNCCLSCVVAAYTLLVCAKLEIPAYYYGTN